MVIDIEAPYPDHIIVMQYEYELYDVKGTRRQKGVVEATDTHTSAAWATLATAKDRPETGWMISVRRIGNDATRARRYVVDRTSGNLQLDKVEHATK
jgi:hypothetical protein